MSSPSKGCGDLDTVVLRHKSGASAEIYLHGATLCSYKTNDGREHIFVSPGAIFDGKKAIRGGVPVVFPQFGQPDTAMPQHGFARSSLWTLLSVSDSAEASVAVLELSTSESTREKWPGSFMLRFEARLTAANLTMMLSVKNTMDAPFSFNALLHTYLKIPDVGRVSIRGLKGGQYIDKVAEGATKDENQEQVVLPSFTDRVYIGGEDGARIVTVHSDLAEDQPLYELTNEARIAGNSQPCDIVVWNPFEAASPGDLPPPAFKNFVCVEPGLVARFWDLPAQATAELTQTILPRSALQSGQGGLDVVVLRHSSGASAEIYLLGATLCSYKTPDGREHIFVSPGAIFDGKKAIRGGVPVVFPQFGQPDKAMAQHGFARSSVWNVKHMSDSNLASTVTLSLSDSIASREKWPHAFALELEVCLTATNLQMMLRITNTGDLPFKFQALLHTYLKVPDVGQAAVRRLEGLSYIDKVAGGQVKVEKEHQVVLPSFTDRVYVGVQPEPKIVTLHGDHAAKPALFEMTNASIVAGEAKPCDIVVWNPYEEASPGDLPPPAFRNFVCVEPGLVSDFSELPAKASAELSQKITAL